METSKNIYQRQGLFITFEGTEGAGKSTQVRRLAAALRVRNYDVCETREPGGTVLGEKLRELVKHGYQGPAPCAMSELLLMAASRAQLVEEVIKPALDRRVIVICDRFADSTTVYQGYGRGLDLTFINQLHHQTVGDCWPNLTLLLDLDLDVSLARAAERTSSRAAMQRTDRFEAEKRSFHHKIQQGFSEVARKNSDRIRTIPAAGSEEEVHRLVMEVVNDALGT